jgi:UDP-N-acetylglucosamine 3-dehydrogenase
LRVRVEVWFVLNAAVIGVGSMGRHHARVYHELKNTRLAAASDISPEAVKDISDKFGCTAYTDYKKMFKNEKLDIVSVVVPTELHKKISIDAASAGINVLVEKPISHDLEDAKKIIGAAKENGVKLAVGHIERFNPAVIELKRMVADGEFGKISSVLAKRVGYFPTNPIDINVIIEMGIHDIDIFNYILEKLPAVIYACGGKSNRENFGEDYANILLDYNGVSALLEVNWITPLKIRRLEITGSDKFAVVDYITQDLVVHEGRYEDGGKYSSESKLKARSQKIEIQKREPLKLELGHFAECILKDKEPINDGKSAYDALKIAKDAIDFLNKSKVE